MKVHIALLVIIGICTLCDPTRALPTSQRVKRQWAWGDDDGGTAVRPTRPPRPVRPTRPTPVQPTQPTEPTPVVPPVTTDSTGTTTTTASPRYLACVAACQSTQQYNPVCGSNRQTYDNLGKLQCAQRCGTEVQMLFNGTCSPLRKRK